MERQKVFWVVLSVSVFVVVVLVVGAFSCGRGCLHPGAVTLTDQARRSTSTRGRRRYDGFRRPATRRRFVSTSAKASRGGTGRRAFPGHRRLRRLGRGVPAGHRRGRHRADLTARASVPPRPRPDQTPPPRSRRRADHRVLDQTGLQSQMKRRISRRSSTARVSRQGFFFDQQGSPGTVSGSGRT
jgi:hypothetical protein